MVDVATDVAGLYGRWQQTQQETEAAASAFIAAALAHLRLRGRGMEAAVWEAQVALGHEARWKAAGYLAWTLGLAPEDHDDHDRV